MVWEKEYSTYIEVMRLRILLKPSAPRAMLGISPEIKTDSQQLVKKFKRSLKSFFCQFRLLASGVIGANVDNHSHYGRQERVQQRREFFQYGRKCGPRKTVCGAVKHS